MSKNLDKYIYGQMDKKAGLEHTFHRTKIVATVGPACDTYEKLLSLVKAGVNVFRLNFSHGSHEDKAKIIEHIRKINSTEPFNIAILGDLQGPKLRVGEIEGGSMLVEEGEILTFTNTKLVGDELTYGEGPNSAHVPLNHKARTSVPGLTGVDQTSVICPSWYTTPWANPPAW